MANIGRTKSPGRSGIYLAAGTLAFAALAAAAPGCGDEDPAVSTSTTSATASASSGGTGGEGTGGAAGTGGAGTGGEAAGTGGAGGAASSACVTPTKGPTRGSAIAISPDDKTLVVANRDVGTVTVMSVDYSGADGQPKMTKTAELDVGKGSEPWQVAIDGCGTRAYVVLRRDQKVVRIDDIANKPAVGLSVAVGSEPTGLALTPNNTRLYVANWVEGTLSVIDPDKMTSIGTVDLNDTLVKTGLLGATITARSALAHPRSLAISNNGDTTDTDEMVLVTEWFAQRTGPETVMTADTNKKGLVYKVNVADDTASTIDLPPIGDTGFHDHNDAVTGCFPNQVGSVSIEGGFAYVTSTCASPKGPIGVFTGAACTALNEKMVCGTLGGTCSVAVGGTCLPNPTDVKTTTHPALTIIDLTMLSSKSVTLDKPFSDATAGRMPLLPTDVAFVNGFGYLSAMGSDGVFRMVFKAGALDSVGSMNNKFINLRKDANDKQIKLPIGIAGGNTQAFGFVANDGSRDVTALSFNTQAIAGDGAADFRITSSSNLPPGGSPEEAVLSGKRLFTTGLGRWSLNGEAWGSCAACHIDGLSDNITWYFARGPRQSVSLDGSFASKDATDQRIFNWTAILDEIADFEGNIRGISGGKGALVDGADARIITANETPPQQGLQGSSDEIATPGGLSAHPHTVLPDWQDIAAWVKTIRSPRRPVGLVKADVDAGKLLFTGVAMGNCVGCHSGAKWTISKRFYTPGDLPNAGTNDMAITSLSKQTWSTALNNFPMALFPSTVAGEQTMRFGAPPGAEQLQCALRPVGTFDVSPAEVDVQEIRQDMMAVAQGNAANGKGFNVPSLLGMQVGAPYFHAGNARTLEEVFDDKLFAGHHTSAIAAVFTMDATKAKQLAAYVLSIDEDEPETAIPAKGNTGGIICSYTP